MRPDILNAVGHYGRADCQQYDTGKQGGRQTDREQIERWGRARNQPHDDLDEDQGKADGQSDDKPGTEHQRPELQQPANGICRKPRAGRERAVTVHQDRCERQMAIGCQKKECCEQRQELTDCGACLSAHGVGHRRKAETHCIADNLACDLCCCKPDLQGETDCEAGKHFGHQHQYSLDRKDA